MPRPPAPSRYKAQREHSDAGDNCRASDQRVPARCQDTAQRASRPGFRRAVGRPHGWRPKRAQRTVLIVVRDEALTADGSRYCRSPLSTSPGGREATDRSRAYNTVLRLALLRRPARFLRPPGRGNTATSGQISAARAAAIHECSLLAGRYSQHDWGNVEIYQYRACMARHGQQE
jgi:hypothetical protein